MAPLYGANYTFLLRIVKKNKHCNWVVFQISTLHVFLETFDQEQKVFSSPRLALYYNVVVGPRFTSILVEDNLRDLGHLPQQFSSYSPSYSPYDVTYDVIGNLHYSASYP